MTNIVPSEILKNKLDDDFVKRSVSGCFFYIFMAVILMYVNWAPPTTEGQVPLNYLMNILIVANIARYFVLKDIINNGAYNLKMQVARAFSLLNPLLWGISFAQVLWLDKFHTESSLVVILLTAGYSAGATMTLAADRFVIFTYHAIMLSPLLVGTILLGYTAQTGRSALVAFSVALYFFYNIFQAISIRRQLINTFKFMYFLEKSKQELEESEMKLKEESAKVIH